MVGSIRGGAAGWVALTAVLLFAVLLPLTWVGFIESDDLEYAKGGIGWLESFPFVGDSHWTLRHMITLPVAASFALFGRGEVPLAIPTVLYAFAIVAMTGLCVRRVAGDLAGALAALLVVGLPVLMTGAAVVYSDIPEAFFILGSLWAYHFATRAGCGRLFVLSGVLAGCGFVTRETTAALLVLYLILFLMAPRRIMDFVRMAAGFLIVVGIDTAWLWAGSGDPFWRFTVSGRGVAGDNPALAHFQMNNAGLDRHGVIVAPRPIQALLAVFTNQTTGLLAWAAVPAAVALWRRRAGVEGAGTGLLFAGLAAVWFGLTSYVFLFMWIVPRYQTVTMVALCVPLAIWLAGRIAQGARLLPAAVVLVLVGSGAGLALVADRELMFGERGLVAFARIAPGPVRTDPATLRGADWLLTVEGLRDKVSAGPCEPGGLCYANPRPRRPLPAGWVAQAVPPGAEVLLEVKRKLTAPARVLSGLGLLPLMPAAVRGKLDPAPVVARGVRMPQ